MGLRSVQNHLCSRGKLAIAAVAFALSMLAWSPDVHAYAWMIRHDYAGCNQCHADPSGGGLLTPYGRAQGEILLRTQYHAGAQDEEPGRVKDFLFGAVELPESLLLGGDTRGLFLATKPDGAKVDTQVMLMQADAEAQLTLDRSRANGSLGFAQQGANGAAITRGDAKLISRVHWLGVDLGEDKQFLLRAGRMNLPFGLRFIEHTMWVRSATRTNINDAQEHGVSFAYNGNGLRAEVMAIAGNFQLSPDQLRERGYSGYIEYAPAAKAAVGVSSLITHAGRDVLAQTPEWRHAHGAFARYAPITQLVLSFEGDFLLSSLPTRSAHGYAGMVQGDFEPVQGVHVMATGELVDRDSATNATSFGGWLSAAWFFAPHADVRIDFVEQSVAAASTRTGVTSFLTQLHVYL